MGMWRAWQGHLVLNDGFEGIHILIPVFYFLGFSDIWWTFFYFDWIFLICSESQFWHGHQIMIMLNLFYVRDRLLLGVGFPFDEMWSELPNSFCWTWYSTWHLGWTWSLYYHVFPFWYFAAFSEVLLIFRLAPIWGDIQNLKKIKGFTLSS